jgi:sugar/nucleoside kinase (ribokinase family)
VFAAIVVGDLTLDLRLPLPSADVLARLARNLDVTAEVELTFALGGSALLFADAIEATGAVSPVVFAAVGDDLPGQVILNAAAERWSTVPHIEVVRDRSTTTVLLGYTPTGGRLMLRPPSAASRFLSEQHMTAGLARVEPGAAALVFVSGYTLATPGASSVAAARTAVQWAREHHVPTVLDLVPHEFNEAVGDLDHVAGTLGQPGVIVAELRTARALGLCGSYSSRTKAATAMEQAAQALDDFCGAGVVQHRLVDETYVQVVSYGGSCTTMHYPVDGSTEFLGLGDRMLVEALGVMRIIPLGP